MSDEFKRIVEEDKPQEGAPHRLRLLLVSLTLSVALAVGAIVLAETLDTSFQSKAELRAFTTIPVLVSIPLLTTEVDRRRALRGLLPRDRA